MWCLLWVSVTDFFSFMLIVALAGDENECPPVHMTVANKTVAWFSEIDEWDVFSKSRLVGLVLIRVYLVGPGPVWWSVDILLTNRQNIFHMIITYFNKSQQITLITKLKEFLITKKVLNILIHVTVKNYNLKEFLTIEEITFNWVGILWC